VEELDDVAPSRVALALHDSRCLVATHRRDVFPAHHFFLAVHQIHSAPDRVAHVRRPLSDHQIPNVVVPHSGHQIPNVVVPSPHCSRHCRVTVSQTLTARVVLDPTSGSWSDVTALTEASQTAKSFVHASVTPTHAVDFHAQALLVD